MRQPEASKLERLGRRGERSIHVYIQGVSSNRTECFTRFYYRETPDLFTDFAFCNITMCFTYKIHVVFHFALLHGTRSNSGVDATLHMSLHLENCILDAKIDECCMKNSVSLNRSYDSF